MNTLKPGLYRATVRGVPDQIVLAIDTGGAFTSSVVGHYRVHNADEITDAYPLIVLDIDHMNIPALITDLRGSAFCTIADQLEAQTKLARIPEPGWDGKIAAHTVMNKVRRSFVRWQDGSEKIHRCCWADHEGMYDWDELIEPTLIREGTS